MLATNFERMERHLDMVSGTPILSSSNLCRQRSTL
jgi:hypothetical protein